MLSDSELSSENANCILPRFDRVTMNSFRVVDFIIISAREGLVAEEMNRLELVANKLEAVRLVPAFGEHIEADLSADTVLDLGEVGGEVGLDRGDELGADAVLVVVLLEGVALALGAAAADGADVDHAVAELEEGAADDGVGALREVLERDAGELGHVLVAEEAGEGLLVEFFAVVERVEAVLGEAVVEAAEDVFADLLLLFVEIGAADEADGVVLAELGEGGEHFGSGLLTRDSESTIDVEENKSITMCHFF